LVSNLDSTEVCSKSGLSLDLDFSLGEIQPHPPLTNS